MKKLDEDDLVRRAIAAHYRSAKAEGGVPEQPGTTSRVRTFKKLPYVVLENAGGTLAVYRVRIVNGETMLKKMKRLPKGF
jgi:hypothetical protein